MLTIGSPQLTTRPRPPKHLCAVDEFDPNASRLFEPAPDVEAWLRHNFIEPGGPLYNPAHEHLQQAMLGVLWAGVPRMRGTKEVLGMAEVPRVQGHKWIQAQRQQQMFEWFGIQPDFMLTFYAAHAHSCADIEWAYLVSHELNHCWYQTDPDGAPRMDKDGNPVWGIRSHDIELFVDDIRLFGTGAGGESVRELAEVMRDDKPAIGDARIRAACGACR